MLVNYSEEFDDISPALLAKSFQKNAEMVSEYRVLSSAGEGIDYQGKVLLNSRAVRLLSYDCETEYARSRMEQKLGVITVEEFLEKILVN